MFRIAVNNEIELDAEVPSVHILKLNPGATARIQVKSKWRAWPPRNRV